MGLSRAVNEGLVPGTEVFVAEMGTYGPGEIRALCELFPPDIAVLTAIGEMHLERMKDREGVLKAKAEITEKARGRRPRRRRSAASVGCGVRGKGPAGPALLGHRHRHRR